MTYHLRVMRIENKTIVLEIDCSRLVVIEIFRNFFNCDFKTVLQVHNLMNATVAML